MLPSKPKPPKIEKKAKPVSETIFVVPEVGQRNVSQVQTENDTTQEYLRASVESGIKHPVFSPNLVTPEPNSATIIKVRKT